MNKIAEAAKERARKQMESDPDHFKRLGKVGQSKIKKPYYHFKELKNNDPQELEKISYRGGRKASFLYPQK